MQSIKEQSLIDSAERIVRKNKAPLDLYELYNLVCAEKGLAENKKKAFIKQFYTDLITSAKFVYTGNNTWDLKEFQKIDLREKDGSYYKEYTVIKSADGSDPAEKATKKKTRKKAKAKAKPKAKPVIKEVKVEEVKVEEVKVEEVKIKEVKVKEVKVEEAKIKVKVDEVIVPKPEVPTFDTKVPESVKDEKASEYEDQISVVKYYLSIITD